MSNPPCPSASRKSYLLRMVLVSLASKVPNVPPAYQALVCGSEQYDPQAMQSHRKLSQTRQRLDRFTLLQSQAEVWCKQASRSPRQHTLTTWKSGPLLNRLQESAAEGGEIPLSATDGLDQPALAPLVCVQILRQP